VKDQFETASFHRQIPLLLTSLRFTSLHLGLPVGARKIRGSDQKSAVSGAQPLPHSASNSPDRLAMTSRFSFLTSYFLHRTSHFSILVFLQTEEMLKIPIVQAMNKSSLFQKDSKLLASPYRVQSHVSVSVSVSVSLSLHFHFPGVYLCIGRAYDQYQYEHHGHKFYRISSVVQKFVFTELAVKFSDFRPSMHFK
jgi:hypothetical protein